MNESGRRFREALAAMPLVAILRGIRPEEAARLAGTLADEGIRLIEVPLNSPSPLRSIEIIASSVGDRAIVGAGTVTDPDSVGSLRDAGGELVVMPHGDGAVIAAARAAGLATVPGVLTPTEAFAALKAGADALKLFPAEIASPPVLRAVLSVLPTGTRVLPVGGIRPEHMHDYLKAGAAGFGLGSGLYTPGMDAVTLGRRAAAYRAAWQRADAGCGESALERDWPSETP